MLRSLLLKKVQNKGLYNGGLQFGRQDVWLKPIASFKPTNNIHIVGQTNSYSTFNARATGNSSGSSSGSGQAKKKKISIWAKFKAFSTFAVSGVLVVGASGLAGLVIYLILSELFSPSGDTRMFNRAVSVVETDPAARQLLQCQDSESHKERLKAYGELLTDDRWTRNRPISSVRRIGRDGKEHHYMRFHVESKAKLALVHVEARQSETSYVPDVISMYMDVPGEKRYYFIKPKVSLPPRKGFLGVNWGPKKEKD
ncbi:LAMI_0B02916g1_1 [Lachancea mirantina]|uniref:Mitochondrial import inner membrane translocase subunit Tim21 n=1 Tax=Lachancea mirantina TaxID=1230905 RepID=A0A1G4IUW3_9SACH|nr:LAMI_0B02916g1_1 [Lachancea mirantina]